MRSIRFLWTTSSYPKISPKWSTLIGCTQNERLHRHAMGTMTLRAGKTARVRAAVAGHSGHSQTRPLSFWWVTVATVARSRPRPSDNYNPPCFTGRQSRHLIPWHVDNNLLVWFCFFQRPLPVVAPSPDAEAPISTMAISHLCPHYYPALVLGGHLHMPLGAMLAAVRPRLARRLPLPLFGIFQLRAVGPCSSDSPFSATSTCPARPLRSYARARGK